MVIPIKNSSVDVPEVQSSVTQFLGAQKSFSDATMMTSPAATDVCKRFWLSPLPYLSIVVIVSVLIYSSYIDMLSVTSRIVHSISLFRGV